MDRHDRNINNYCYYTAEFYCFCKMLRGVLRSAFLYNLLMREVSVIIIIVEDKWGHPSLSQ